MLTSPWSPLVAVVMKKLPVGRIQSVARGTVDGMGKNLMISQSYNCNVVDLRTASQQYTYILCVIF
jgi:hypothetical protein